MQKRQVRLQDLAKELGISTATVSRALKDYPDISAETKRKVLELAKKLNYRPNSIAAGLRKSETHIIGVIIPEIVNHFFGKVIKGIMEVAYDKGYKVMLCQSDEDYEKEVTDANALLSSRVDGLIACLGTHTHQFDHFHDFIDAGIPVVFFDKTAPQIRDCSKVIIDDRLGAFNAVESLIEEGCTRIAHLKGPGEAFTFQNRLQGYKDALAKHGIPFDPSLIRECRELTHSTARSVARDLAGMPVPPDAVFAATDQLAIGAMVGLKEMGKSIPEDVAVIGFSNWEVGEAVDPPLSSVAQPGFEMGKLSAEILLREIQATKNDHPFEYETVVLETSLKLRGSSRRSARQEAKTG